MNYYGYETKEFRHWFFGKMAVTGNGRHLLFPALKCAKCLVLLRRRVALKTSGAVVCRTYDFKITDKTMIDEFDVWRLIDRYRAWPRDIVASKFYDWVYDEIVPNMVCDKEEFEYAQAENSAETGTENPFGEDSES